MKQIAFLIVLVFTTASVQAAPITFHSIWRIWKVNDPDSMFENIFQVDDTISISITLELSTADSNPDNLHGQYADAIISAELTAGSSVFTGNGSASTHAFPLTYIFGQQITFSGQLNSGPVLFSASSDLASQASDSLLWMASNPPRVDSSAGVLEINSATVNVLQQGEFITPLPGGAWLLGSGLIGLMAISRRRFKL